MICLSSQLSLVPAIDPSSFYGKLRALYADQVLYTQLQQMRKQGSYDAFDLKWQEVYNVRPLKGARTRVSSGSVAMEEDEADFGVGRRNPAFAFLGIRRW